MKTLDFFAEWTWELATALDAIADSCPCFIKTTPVEMNWQEIEIKARQEDMPKIETLLAEFV